MKVLLLVNTSASSVTARARIVIQKALAADHEVKMAETSRRGHAQRLAQGAAATGTDVVVVLGGDGTLNEAANGIVGSTTALGVLPGGSTNVFARTIGMAHDPIEATGQLVAALAAGHQRRIGVGSANGRYFLFHVGIGFDAAVVEQVEKRGALKRYAGHPLFAWAAVLTWMRHYERRRARFAVRFPDGSLVDDGYFGICLKTSPYTYLGNRPFKVGREANLDSRLVMVTFRSLTLTTLLTAAASALASGRRLRRDRKIDQRPDLDEVVITGHGRVPYQVDGDFLGEVDQLVLRYEPDCLELIQPQ